MSTFCVAFVSGILCFTSYSTSYSPPVTQCLLVYALTLKHSKFNFEKTISEGPKHALIYAPRRLVVSDFKFYYLCVAKQIYLQKYFRSPPAFLVRSDL